MPDLNLPGRVTELQGTLRRCIADVEARDSQFAGLAALRRLQEIVGGFQRPLAALEQVGSLSTDDAAMLLGGLLGWARECHAELREVAS